MLTAMILPVHFTALTSWSHFAIVLLTKVMPSYVKVTFSAKFAHSFVVASTHRVEC